MRTTILLFLILPLFIACGDGDKTPARKEPDVSSTTTDYTPELDKEFKSLGFVLPNQTTLAPDFTLTDLAGIQRSLSSFQGKLVLLNFWGAWCFYCRQEMPSMQRLYDVLHKDGFEIVAVNVQDTEQAARDYITKNNHTFPVLLDKEFIATRMYGIRGFPTTYIIDKQGSLRAMLVGTRQWDTDDITKLLRKML